MLLPDWVTLNARLLPSAMLPLPVTVAALRVTLPVVVLVVVRPLLRVRIPPVTVMGPLMLTGLLMVIPPVFPTFPRVRPEMDGAQVMLPRVVVAKLKLVSNGWMVT